jgi:hypothetical protein
LRDIPELANDVQILDKDIPGHVCRNTDIKPSDETGVYINPCIYLKAPCLKLAICID